MSTIIKFSILIENAVIFQTQIPQYLQLFENIYFINDLPLHLSYPPPIHPVHNVYHSIAAPTNWCLVAHRTLSLRFSLVHIGI